MCSVPNGFVLGHIFIFPRLILLFFGLLLAYHDIPLSSKNDAHALRAFG